MTEDQEIRANWNLQEILLQIAGFCDFHHVKTPKKPFIHLKKSKRYNQQMRAAPYNIYQAQ